MVNEGKGYREKFEAAVAASIEAGFEMPDALSLVASLYEDDSPEPLDWPWPLVNGKIMVDSFFAASYLSQEYMPLSLAWATVKACRATKANREQAVRLFLGMVEMEMGSKRGVNKGGDRDDTGRGNAVNDPG